MIPMKVCAILGAMLVASASAVASDASIGYEKEMAALEPDEWAPKQQGGKEGATELIQEGATTKVQPSPSETAFSENAGENGPTSLFPGPTTALRDRFLRECGREWPHQFVPWSNHRPQRPLSPRMRARMAPPVCSLVQPSPSETAFSENAGENGPTSLFPGPTIALRDRFLR